MSYLATALITGWIIGLLFLIGQMLNDIRLILNNLAPGEGYAGHWLVTPLSIGWRIRATWVDPSRLTDVGRLHQKTAIRHERIMFAWMIVGFILIVGTYSYFNR